MKCWRLKSGVQAQALAASDGSRRSICAVSLPLMRKEKALPECGEGFFLASEMCSDVAADLHCKAAPSGDILVRGLPHRSDDGRSHGSDKHRCHPSAYTANNHSRYSRPQARHSRTRL